MLVMTLDNPVQNLTTKVWAGRRGRGGGGRYPQFSWYLQESVKATFFEGSETFIVFSLVRGPGQFPTVSPSQHGKGLRCGRGASRTDSRASHTPAKQSF